MLTVTLRPALVTFMTVTRTPPWPSNPPASELGAGGEICCGLDHLDLAGVDPEPEALAQQPSDGGGDLDLVDVGCEIESQEPGTAGVVVADVGGPNTGNAAQGEQDFVDADGSTGGHGFLVGV